MSSLEDRQAALVRALVDGTQPPPGFDRDALAAASEVLARKRSRKTPPVRRRWYQRLLRK